MSRQNKTSKSSCNNYDCLSIVLIAFIILVVLAILSCYIYTSNAVINSNSFNIEGSFIGTMATVMGVLVTFVIGYQILNAIQIKKDVETMQKKAEKQKREIKSAMKNLKKDFADKNTILEKRLELDLAYLKLTNASEQIHKLSDLAKYIDAITVYVKSTQKIVRNNMSKILLDKRKNDFIMNTNCFYDIIDDLKRLENINPNNDTQDQTISSKKEYDNYMIYENVTNHLLYMCENEFDSDIKHSLNHIRGLLDENQLLPTLDDDIDTDTIQ